MSGVHPSAIVDKRAQLAPDVQIGPWCVIEGPVTLGPRTRLLHNVSLKGPLTIGSDNVIYPFAMLGYEPQDRKFDPATEGAGLLIGDRNIIRESVTFHRATKDRPTTIGSDGYFMVNSHVAHDCLIGNNVTLVNGSLIAGHCEIHDEAILGGNAAVHQGCRVGRMSMIAGNRGVIKDLPPFCVVHDPKRVGSLNLVGMRRAGLRDHIKPLTVAFDIFFRQGHTTSAALQAIEDAVGDNPIVREFADFIRGTKRGITPYADSGFMDDYAMQDRLSRAEKEDLAARYNKT